MGREVNYFLHEKEIYFDVYKALNDYISFIFV